MCQNCIDYQEFILRYRDRLKYREEPPHSLAHINYSLQCRLCEYLADKLTCGADYQCSRVIRHHLKEFKNELESYGLDMDDWFRAVEVDIRDILVK